MKKFALKQRLATVVVFLVLCGIIGLAVTVSGVVPIKASSGHWPITKWFLEFSKSRSVATHSFGIEVPPLDDPDLVLKGAGHYETGCVQCHGSPTRPASPIALAMTATPPALPPKIAVREPAELFYIVKHGIKFTGMPAWPSQERDDEVWAVVAFLLQLPTMDAATYQRLVEVEPADSSVDATSTATTLLLESCHRCHGADGLGRSSGAFPVLAGQHQQYLLATMEAYSAGKRDSGIMEPVVAILDQSELETLAAHFADLPRGDEERASQACLRETAAAIERGETIAERGIPERQVPSCADCHGPHHEPRSPNYPRLDGQPADYLVLQLELFKARTRGGTDYAHVMDQVVTGLTADQMRDVALYYESRVPDSD